MNSIKLIGQSIKHYSYLVRKNRLHLRSHRLGERYHIAPYGTYTIFRETESEEKVAKEKTVIVVGFRLRIVGSLPFFHFLFQKICILTTPFWSGFSGFHIKLWMVDQETKNYVGIYEWYGKENARTYVQTLIKILTPLATANSFWFRINKNIKLIKFLEKRIASPPCDQYRIKLRFDELAFNNHNEVFIVSMIFLTGMVVQALLQSVTPVTVSSVIEISLLIILTMKLFNNRKNVKHSRQWYE